MPFLDLTEAMDQEYMVDAVAEALIDELSKVPNLRVPALRSSFSFKGKQPTIAEIAKTLKVSYVLDGSVRKSGETFRFTARLIRAQDGHVAWTQTYERSAADISTLHDDIAAKVMTSLGITAASTREDDARSGLSGL